MKLFKSLLGLVLILLLSSSVTFGQDAGKPAMQRPAMDPEVRAQKQTDNLAKKVELTEKQVKEMKKIYTKYNKQRIEAKKLTDMAQRRTKLTNITRDENKAIEEAMTANQLKAYKESRQKRKQELDQKFAAQMKKKEAIERERRTGVKQPVSTDNAEQKKSPVNKAQKTTDEMVKNLGLTREQVPQVMKININFHEGMDKAKSLSNDKEAWTAEVKKLKAAQEGALKKVLTEEQIEKL